ncbi:MAG: hypothetical protein ACOYIA_07230 [Eubacteriales bacterium]|jgi:putative aldouronate transport system substrate-binding protein
MKKKLTCLVLCAVLVISSLLVAGCSQQQMDEEAQREEASRGTATLNWYLMTEEGTTPEAAKAIEEAVNKITKSKFKTKVNMFFFTEDEYYEALEQTFNTKEQERIEKETADKELKKFIRENKDVYSREEAQKIFYELHPEYAKYAETTTDPLAETTVEETFYNPETGLLELKYPEADPNVVDIFFLSGYERLLEYIDKEWVNRLDDELNSGSKKLKDYISSAFLDSVKIDGATYAIPNNRTIGEYTYMLVNKELLAKYYYNINDIHDLIDCQEFLEDIAAFEPDVVPIDGSPELYNVLYWSIDPDTLEIDTKEFSVIGTTYTTFATLGTPLQFTSLIATRKPYRDQLLINRLYEDRGYFRSNVPESAKCAIKIVKGGAELEKEYAKDYHMVALKAPRASQEMIFESMFAVGGFSNNVARSMEIITYLNTNAELRNLVLYGLENVNYTLDDKGQVVRTENNSYRMDINKTGNVFIAYTEAGTDPDIWTYGIKQNQDATVDLLLGFTFKGEKVNTESIRKIQEISESVKARIDACKSYEELSALMDQLMLELRSQSNPDIRDYTNILTEPNEDGESVPYVIFNQWLIDKGFITEE